MLLNLTKFLILWHHIFKIHSTLHHKGAIKRCSLTEWSHKWFFCGISFIFKSVACKLDIFTEYYDSVGQIIAVFSVHVFIVVLWLCIKTKQALGSSFSCSSLQGPDCVITPAAQCHETLTALHDGWSDTTSRYAFTPSRKCPVKKCAEGGGGHLVTLTSLLMAQNYRPGLKRKMLTGMTRPLSGSIRGAAVDIPRLLLDHYPPTPLIFILTRVWRHARF